MSKNLKSYVAGGLLSLAVSFGAFGTIVKWDAGVGGNNHWYQTVVTEQGIDWASAQANAAALGGYLVTIRSQAEQNFIANNSLIKNPATLAPGEFQLQNSYWTGGVADVTSIADLTLGSQTSWHWNNGESFDYTNPNWGLADGDGLDGSATGNVIPDLFYSSFFQTEYESVLASYLRISADDSFNIGNWSDQPENGIINSMRVDFATGAITEPLIPNQFIYGYLVEFDSRPASLPVPAPATFVLFGFALTCMRLLRRNKVKKLT